MLQNRTAGVTSNPDSAAHPAACAKIASLYNVKTLRETLLRILEIRVVVVVDLLIFIPLT